MTFFSPEHSPMFSLRVIGVFCCFVVVIIVVVVVLLKKKKRLLLSSWEITFGR